MIFDPGYDQSELEALLTLASAPGIGPTRLRKLLSKFKTAAAVLQAPARELIQTEGIDLLTAEKIKESTDPNFAADQIERMKKHGCSVMTFWDEVYPETLKRIYDPPAFLFFKGDLSALRENYIAVVGTRNPTGYGKMVTGRFSTALANAGYGIISGLARGVDTIAHQAALKAGQKTIAVLGNGLDINYPAQNRELAERIANEGLMLSEYVMGTGPDAGNFPKRNRIISGLSLGVLVTEAGSRSGALITALYALDQNREIFSVPGAITSEQSSGTNRLIKQGAKLVQSVEDILNEINPITGRQAEKEKRPPVKLDGSLQQVYDVLDNEPLHIDQVALKTGLSIAETLSVLLTLELLDHVKQLAGKMFIRNL